MFRQTSAVSADLGPTASRRHIIKKRNQGRPSDIAFRMPLYFFDLHNDMDALDAEGQELPGLSAAESLALKEARQIIAASVTEQGKIDLRHNIEGARRKRRDCPLHRV
jgi:hypothetical protein